MMSEQLVRSARVLRRHWRIVVLIPLLALAVSLVVSSRSATEYTATAKVVISPFNPVTELLNPGSNPTPADPERDLNTEVLQITETPVADLVRAELGLHESSQDLLQSVNASIEGTTNIADITVTDGSAARAARIANAFARQYESFRLASQRSALLQAVAGFKQRLLGLTAAEQSAPAGQQLQATISTLEADSDGLTSDVQISQRASVPTSATQPRPLVDGLIAVVVGLLVAIILVIALELLDRTVRDEEDATSLTRLRSLGVIPRMRSLGAASVNDRRMRRVRATNTGAARPSGGRTRAADERPLDALSASNGPSAPASSARSLDLEISESYGALAVSLLALKLGPPENAVMITSSGPQDGKTSVTLGLAAALAELGQSVIVVECDMRRPRIANYLGLPPWAPGLSSVLAGTDAASTCLVKVAASTGQAVPGRGRARVSARRAAAGANPNAGRSFQVLPCGPIPARPLAMLRDAELLPLLRELQTSADIVLVDTPPLGPIKDAVVVAESVDQIVLVARIGHTDRDALVRCRAEAEQLGSPVLGIVTVGGPRGGTLDYYLRTELDASVVRLSEPKLVAVRQPIPEPDPKPEVPPRRKPLPETAAAKSGRSRRQASAENSG